MVEYELGGNEHHHRSAWITRLSAWLGGLRLHCHLRQCSFFLWRLLYIHAWAGKRKEPWYVCKENAYRRLVGALTDHWRRLTGPSGSSAWLTSFTDIYGFVQ